MNRVDDLFYSSLESPAVFALIFGQQRAEALHNFPILPGHVFRFSDVVREIVEFEG